MAETARRDVFQAIADPTRRKIIELLTGERMNLQAIATQLKMSQPAISQQVKILQECGIVTIETTGRERFCTVETKSLVPAFLWLEQYHRQWTERIDSFGQYVNKLQSKTKNKKSNAHEYAKRCIKTDINDKQSF